MAHNMIKRIPEPELMEDRKQVLAYNNADFSSSNQLFINYIISNSNKKIFKLLDIGCGPGDIDIELAKHFDDIKILAIDGSFEMVKLAKLNIKTHHLINKIEIKKGKLPDLNIKTKEYDTIISKDLLHHIPNPDDFWNEVVRLSNEFTSIYIMDLLRPNSKEEAKRIVESVSANEPDILKTDFYNSLLAAFTMNEIEDQVKKTNLFYKLDKLGDRHFILECNLKK